MTQREAVKRLTAAERQLREAATRAAYWRNVRRQALDRLLLGKARP